MGPSYAVPAPWLLILVPLQATMRAMQLLQFVLPRRPLRCSLLCAAALVLFLVLFFFFQASVDLELQPFGLLQLHFFCLFGLRGSVEI